jgi:hypothetical protein
MAESLPPVPPLTGSGAWEREESGPSPIPGPLLLDFSFSGLEEPELEEALGNQPAKVFLSVETVLGTNLGLVSGPKTLGLYAAALKHLDLSFNALTALPPSILNLPHLLTLILKNNRIPDDGFPKDLSPLMSLREVNLSGNDLTRLPEPILALAPSLITLHLGGNRLGSLPREIAQLSKLQVRPLR